MTKAALGVRTVKAGLRVKTVQAAGLGMTEITEMVSRKWKDIEIRTWCWWQWNQGLVGRQWKQDLAWGQWNQDLVWELWKRDFAWGLWNKRDFVWGQWKRDFVWGQWKEDLVWGAVKTWLCVRAVKTGLGVRAVKTWLCVRAVKTGLGVRAMKTGLGARAVKTWLCVRTVKTGLGVRTLLSTITSIYNLKGRFTQTAFAHLKENNFCNPFQSAYRLDTATRPRCKRFAKRYGRRQFFCSTLTGSFSCIWYYRSPNSSFPSRNCLWHPLYRSPVVLIISSGQTSVRGYQQFCFLFFSSRVWRSTGLSAGTCAVCFVHYSTFRDHNQSLSQTSAFWRRHPTSEINSIKWCIKPYTWPAITHRSHKSMGVQPPTQF